MHHSSEVQNQLEMEQLSDGARQPSVHQQMVDGSNVNMRTVADEQRHIELQMIMK